jgi:hypothetical protein
MAKEVILLKVINGPDGKLHKPGAKLTFDNGLAARLVLRGCAKWPDEKAADAPAKEPAKPVVPPAQTSAPRPAAPAPAKAVTA